VAKDSSKGKNTDNIDTYLDTSFLFPEILKNKKVKINKKKYNLSEKTKEYFDNLQKYLDTKDLKKLLLALRIDDHVLWNGRINFQKLLLKLQQKIHKEKYGSELVFPKCISSELTSLDELPKNITYLPDYFIIWYSLINLSNSYFPVPLNERGEYEHSRKINEYIKNYLNKIYPLLVVNRKKSIISPYCRKDLDRRLSSKDPYLKDGLIHGGKKGVVLGYADDNPYDLLYSFKEIKTVLESNLKSRYLIENEEKLRDILESLNLIGIELSPEEIKEYKRYPGDSIDMIVSCILAILHNRKCSNEIKYRSVYNLYKKANNYS